MITLKKDEYYIIDETILNKDESKNFITYLKIELNRHNDSKTDCWCKMYCAKSDLYFFFWFSGYKRHLKDIEMIRKTIKYLTHKWSI